MSIIKSAHSGVNVINYFLLHPPFNVYSNFLSLLVLSFKVKICLCQLAIFRKTPKTHKNSKLRLSNFYASCPTLKTYKSVKNLSKTKIRLVFLTYVLRSIFFMPKPSYQLSFGFRHSPRVILHNQMVDGKLSPFMKSFTLLLLNCRVCKKEIHQIYLAIL